MFTPHDLDGLPGEPGVYLFKDAAGTVIYIGKAKILKKRVKSYFQKTHVDPRIDILVSKIHSIDVQTVSSELEALLLESQLIKELRPFYNINLRDDKAYPYLKLTNEAWPRLVMVRKIIADGAEYFGPFQGGILKRLLRVIKKIFPIRWCSETPLRLRQRLCLEYDIGRCIGPCVTGTTSPREYKKICAEISDFLRGKISQVRESLEAEMSRAAEKTQYEAAQIIRDRLRALNELVANTHLPLEKEEYYLEGIGDREQGTGDREQVADLRKQLGLTKNPERIEAFDISHISGTNPYGSLVTFQDGVPYKDHYRLFKIRTTKGIPDDTTAIYEIVKRRYGGRLKDSLPLPDLILIDGGLGQVNFAKKALQELNIDVPVIGIAKRFEEIYFPARNKPIALLRGSKALYLLQRLRDEAHRFAIKHHRRARGRGMRRKR